MANLDYGTNGYWENYLFVTKQHGKRKMNTDFINITEIVSSIKSIDLH